MKKYDLEFTEVNGQGGASAARPPTSDVPAEPLSSRGCVVTRSQGLLLLLTAAAVAAGVGVAVHYLSPDRVNCQLDDGGTGLGGKISN